MVLFAIEVNQGDYYSNCVNVIHSIVCEEGGVDCLLVALVSGLGGQ